MEKSCRVRSSVGIIKLKYMNSFRIVESWLCEKGYEVLLETDGEDAVYFDCSQIVINSRNHIEKRLYILLHECGHILINNNSKLKNIVFSPPTPNIYRKSCKNMVFITVFHFLYHVFFTKFRKPLCFTKMYKPKIPWGEDGTIHKN